MKPHKLFIFVSACNLLLWIFVAARPTKESFEKITVKEFELVDDSARRHKRSRILYLDHVEADGCLLFDQIVAMDLEGIVCKRKDSPYNVTEKPSRHWIKIKNSRYSQLEGREELFERA